MWARICKDMILKLKQRRILNPVEHLGWSFFAKMVNGKAGPMFYATPTKKKTKKQKQFNYLAFGNLHSIWHHKWE